MQNKIQINKLDYSSLYEVSEIHLASFRNSALSKLGKEVVLRYYQRQLKDSSKLHAIGAYMDGKMIGYCFGGIFGGAVSDYLYKNKAFLIKQLLLRPWLLLSPTYFRKVLGGLLALINFTRNKNRAIAGQAAPEPNDFWILSIASSPKARGLGVGKRLMEYSEEYARNQDFKKMFLTVNPKNTNAIRFYEHIGWVKDANTQNWQGRMKKDLKNDRFI